MVGIQSCAVHPAEEAERSGCAEAASYLGEMLPTLDRGHVVLKPIIIERFPLRRVWRATLFPLIILF